MARLLSLFALLALVSAVALAEPAIVINRGTGACGLPGADENGNIISGGIGFATNIIENRNKVMLKCHSDDLVNLSGKAQSFSGFVCGIITPEGKFFGTMDSHASVSANGEDDGSGNNGTLTCVYKKH